MSALPLLDLRAALKASMTGPDAVLDLGRMAKQLKCPEAELDRILSEATAVGYVEPWPPIGKDTSREGPGWRVAEPGLRLVHDRMGPPIPRMEAAAALAAALDRLRAFNKEGSGLAVTEGRLFGSFLDRSRATVGDVDLDIKLVPNGWHHGYGAVGLREMERVQGKLERDLTKGLDEVQISFGEVETLGCPFEVVYRFDRVTSTSEISFWS